MATQPVVVFTKIGPVVFDATLKETHKGTAKITESPVEVGSKTSDNVRPLPLELTIQGVVTDFPVRQSATAALTTALANEIGAEVQTPTRAAYEALENIRVQGLLSNVVTNLRTYSNMAISDVTTTQDMQHTFSAEITVTMKQIQIADSATVTLPKPKSTAQKPTEKKGEQSTTKGDGKSKAITLEFATSLAKGLNAKTATGALLQGLFP